VLLMLKVRLTELNHFPDDTTILPTLEIARSTVRDVDSMNAAITSVTVIQLILH
jgi:hypothetical protein